MHSGDDTATGMEVDAQCPTMDVLKQFLSGKIGEKLEAEIARHLDGCSTCQLRSELLTQRTEWSRSLEWLSPENPLLDRLMAGDSDELRLLEPGVEGLTGASATTRYGLSGEALPQPPAIPGLIPGWSALQSRFELRETVGVGGCGTVFRAWDRFLHRQVALKVPHWPLFSHDEVRRRFGIEARAAARLNHWGIVPIFEAQITDKLCFLASEFVPGPSLAGWLAVERKAGRPIPCRTAAAVLWNLAEATRAAHAENVLHRDLKPANVLLDIARPGPELPFTPRITDFGLARLAEDAGPTTMDGSVAGSLPYMSPEQAAGAGTLIGPAVDIYALGVILYELLTGRLPISGRTPAEYLQRVPRDLPVDPSRIRPDIPADLEAICLKCLEKRPQDRYASAGLLAEELRRFLSGQSVQVRRPAPAEQVARWLRRHPMAARLTAMSLLSVVAIIGIVAYANLRLRRSNDDLAVANRRLAAALAQSGDLRVVAEQQRKDALQKLYFSRIQRAGQAWRDRDLPELELLLASLDVDELAPLHGIEHSWLRSKLAVPYRQLTTLPGAAYSVAYSQDGQRMAATGAAATVRIINFQDGRTLIEWPTGQRECNDLLFVDDDRALWTSGDDGTVRKWDVATGRELLRLPGHSGEQSHNLLSLPELGLLLSSGSDGAVRGWDLRTGAVRYVLEGHSRSICSMALLPGGQQLLTMGHDDRAAVWNLQTGTRHVAWSVGEFGPESFLLSEDRKRLVLSTRDRKLVVLDAATHARLAETPLLDRIDCLVTVPEGDLIIGADRQGVLHAFRSDLAPLRIAGMEATRNSPQQLTATLLRAHRDRIFRLSVSPDRREVISCGKDGQIRAWPMERMDPSRPLVRFPGPISDLLDYRGSSLALIQVDNQLLPVDTSTLKVAAAAVRASGRPTSNQILCAAISPSGRLVTAEADPTTGHECLVVRDDRSQPPSATWSVAPQVRGMSELVLDSTGRFAVLRRLGTKALQRFDLAGPGEIESLNFAENVSHFAMSPVGPEMAVSVGTEVLLVDPRSGSTLWRDQTLRLSIEALQFSADGQRLAAACSDRSVCLWNVPARTVVARLTGHRFQPEAVEFSPDRTLLISGDQSGGIKLWRVETGEFLYDLDIPLIAPSCRRLRFTADGQHLLIVDANGNLTTVPLAP